MSNTSTTQGAACDWTPRASVWLTAHASLERMRQYGLNGLDVLEALGPDLVVNGELTCRRSDTLSGGVPPTPRPGDPVLIGRQYPVGKDPLLVLLGTTTKERRLHLIVDANPRLVTVLTVWCPDDPHNQHFWAPHAMLPTNLGIRELDPTHWYLGDPLVPQRNPHRGGLR